MGEIPEKEFQVMLNLWFGFKNCQKAFWWYIVLEASHKCIISPFKRKVPLVIDEIIDIPGFGGVDIGDVIKVKTFGQQFCFGRSRFVLRIQLFQDSVVLSKLVIDISHQVSWILVQIIIIGISTVIATEFLINPADNLSAAFWTIPLHKLKIKNLLMMLNN